MIRSLLYVPGSAERFIAKAHLRGADAIIVDLEDAVAPKEKVSAREALADVVARVGQGGAKVFVRVNNDPELLLADAQAACRAGAFGLYVPKVSSAGLLHTLDAALAPIESSLARPPMVFVPLLEDAGSVLAAQSIAGGPRVFALSAGGEDLATSMGAEPTPEVLRLPKLMIHMAAKAAGRYSFGLLRTVADYQDLDVLKAAVKEARTFGFDGASCIHPSVVAVLNEGFSPSETELARARRLIDAAEQAAQDGIGAFTFEGAFIDAPIVTRARELLARFGAAR
ncbi:CoA ester lyase [Pusillimonas sp. SM2304]|uniref:HpcH/HpaI aldolase/citrate lyase family protein n=1 Tax=Pusillimonas sp. SM2304 TaxID=3073241 RepID=UPI00287638DD|nr:CoA ester lyase [Pusillimonas sp. SM2304]MDS1139935.1 CoA ester lyase [Pusillimonas sp. SM2304]